MAAAIVPLIAPLVIPLISSLLPQIIQLFQKAHPIPVDAPPAVKTDLNTLKQTGALSTAMALVQQLATAGKLPVSATDASLIAAVAGAIEQQYQSMKTDGTLNAPLVVPAPISTATTPQVIPLPPGRVLVVTT